MIDNPDAYERGKNRAIKNNYRTANRRKWLEAHEDAQRLYDWLNSCGEFADKVVTKLPGDQEHYDRQVAELWARANEEGFDPHADLWVLDDRFETSIEHHPLTRGMFAGNFGEFLLKLRDDLDEWGRLSDKQTETVRKSLARAEKWEAEREEKMAARKAEDAKSKHVGLPGERLTFHLTVHKRLSFDGQYGTTYVHLCRDEDGNVLVYKGTQMWPQGRKIVVVATIKANEERDGVKQTLLARPKLQE